MSDIDNLFLRPEKPFLVLYEIENELGRELSYAWLDSIEAVQELLDELEKWHKDKYEILDCVEIGSLREVKLEEG